MTKRRRAPRSAFEPHAESGTGSDIRSGSGAEAGSDLGHDPARLPWKAIEGGVELAVRLTPKAGRAAIEGIGEAGGQPVLRVRVAAPPVDGAANAALVDLLAKTLRMPRSDIELIAGERARVKRLRLLGADLAGRLGALIDPA